MNIRRLTNLTMSSSIKDSPYKKQLIKAFGDLLAHDCYEIVI